MCDMETCNAIMPDRNDAKADAKHKVLDRAVETILKLCEKVDCGTASCDEMSTLVDLIRTVAY